MKFAEMKKRTKFYHRLFDDNRKKLAQAVLPLFKSGFQSDTSNMNQIT